MLLQVNVKQRAATAVAETWSQVDYGGPGVKFWGLNVCNKSNLKQPKTSPASPQSSSSTTTVKTQYRTSGEEGDKYRKTPLSVWCTWASMVDSIAKNVGMTSGVVLKKL